MKSRIQGAEKIPGVVPKYNWTYPGIVTIFREEGPAALYKGFVPKVLRLAPGGGVLLLVVEVTLGLFRQGTFVFVSHSEPIFTKLSSLSVGPTIHLILCTIDCRTGVLCMYTLRTRLLTCIIHAL